MDVSNNIIIMSIIIIIVIVIIIIDANLFSILRYGNLLVKFTKPVD
jgi:hypothetical protein